MKGLISNQNGPKLEEILRMLAQSDTPTHVALRGFGHTQNASVSLRDGRLLNATSGTATGTEALKALLSQDSWHFETFPELQSTRADFSGDLDVGTQIIGLRAEMQAFRAEAEVDARRIHRFKVVNESVSGDVPAGDQLKLEEEFNFLSYYAREMGSSLGLGVSKALAYCELERALALKLRGDEWDGAYCKRQSSLAQILSEVA